MRDPKRIQTVLKAIEEVWQKNPDLRLGQMIVTATNLSGRKAVSPEVFSLEDEDMLRGIEALKKKEPNQSSEPMPLKRHGSP
jgi:hypothetical protein